MGILLFVLKYMFSSLLLKMIQGFSWSANIMASPFKVEYGWEVAVQRMVLQEFITCSVFNYYELIV